VAESGQTSEETLGRPSIQIGTASAIAEAEGEIKMSMIEIVAKVFKALEDRGVDLDDFGAVSVDEIAAEIEGGNDEAQDGR
jgi:hypothetical protein